MEPMMNRKFICIYEQPTLKHNSISKEAQHAKDQLANIQIKIEGGQSRMDRYTAEMYELFSEAKIQNEQAYYEMHEQFEQRRKIETELQTVQAQLSSLDLQQKKNLMEDTVNEGIFALQQEQTVIAIRN